MRNHAVALRGADESVPTMGMERPAGLETIYEPACLRFFQAQPDLTYCNNSRAA